MHKLGIVSLLAAMTTTAPGWSAGLDEPAMEAEMIIAETEGGAAKEDGLILTLWLMTVFAAAGGAFN